MTVHVRSDVRDIGSLRLHPAAERVPLADGTDLSTLRASLADDGQQDPIDITPDGMVLDGRTRIVLLSELGAQTVQVRVVDMPPEQQVHYIVQRALARRHLTMDQKRALNDLLRITVVEVATHPSTGEEVRVGLSRPARAAKLGVNKDTVVDWDRRSVGNPTDPSFEQVPTHIRRAGDNALYPTKPTPPAGRPVRSKTTRVAPKRYAPIWRRHFTRWCRLALPEDRQFFLEMDVELHKGLRQMGSGCEHTGGPNGAQVGSD